MFPRRLADLVTARAETSEIIQNVTLLDVVRFDAEIRETERVGLLEVIFALGVDVSTRQTQRGGERERNAAQEELVRAREGAHDEARDVRRRSARTSRSED